MTRRNTRPNFGYNSYNRSQTPLTMDRIEYLAPAIFADSPIDTVSDRYRFIPTRQVFEAIVDSGYQVVHVQTARSRANADKAKHLVVFQPRDTLAMRNVGDTVSQLRLINGHDGKTGYNLTAGMFRLACLNGLVVSDGVKGSVRVKHVGNDVIERVVRGILEINQYLPEAIEIKNEMEHILIDREAEEAMAKAAIALRWGKPNRGDLHLPDGTVIVMPKNVPVEAVDVTDTADDDEPSAPVGPLRAPVTISQMLQTRRTADYDNNLWVGMNRIQENLINPNFTGENINDLTGDRNFRKVSRVTDVNKDQKINMGLWVLANEMRDILAGAVA